MSQDDSAVGVFGVESIRVNRKKIENLPMVPSAMARPQIQVSVETQKENERDSIKARYPTGSIVYYDSRIKECKENIERIKLMKSREEQTISQYTGQIALCSHRDKELAKTDDPEEIKALKRKFPMYNVEAMEQQIKQCREGIDRADQVIEQEYQSITELSEAIALCRKRDAELKAV